MMLLLFTLYQVRNSPYQMGLIPLEIMYDVSAPILPNLQLAAVAELEDDELVIGVKATQQVYKYVWPKLHALYEEGLVPEPQKF